MHCWPRWEVTGCSLWQIHNSGFHFLVTHLPLRLCWEIRTQKSTRRETWLLNWPIAHIYDYMGFVANGNCWDPLCVAQPLMKAFQQNIPESLQHAWSGRVPSCLVNWREGTSREATARRAWVQECGSLGNAIQFPQIAEIPERLWGRLCWVAMAMML